MEKGKLLGRGMTAEVYEWGKDKVLKLFLDKFDEEWVKREAEIGKKIHEAGVPSPEVFDIVEVNGRKGIVFQRIAGKTAVGCIQTEPWMFAGYIQRMAEFQYKIHQYSTDGIPSQKERFAYAIMRSSDILGDKVEKILNYINQLPEGDSICHGDFYLGNIMVSHNKLVAIDWSTCYRGDPSGDVARTCLIISSPALPPGIPEFFSPVSAYLRGLTYQSYLNEYLRLSKVKFESIDAWILPVAAVKLRDRIPGEERWLMEMISNRLKRLEI